MSTFAILGKGKTGSKVIELLNERGNNIIIFDSKNKLTPEKLAGCDVVISFLPGDAFLEYIPALLDSGKNVVTGSTGFEWPKDIDQNIKENKSIWIKAHNFSLGMNLVHEMIKKLSKTSSLFKSYKFNMHEVHHTKKVDAPSGTALSWQDWLGLPVDITHERKGDVIGYHELELITDNEKIKLSHEALDRKIFAQGAVWAADLLLRVNNEEDTLEYGLHHFSDIAKNEINKSL